MGRNYALPLAARWPDGRLFFRMLELGRGKRIKGEGQCRRREREGANSGLVRTGSRQHQPVITWVAGAGTQGNQGRDLLVGGLYIRVYFDLEKLKQLTIFSFPPLSLCLGCLQSVALDFGCLGVLKH